MPTRSEPRRIPSTPTGYDGKDSDHDLVRLKRESPAKRRGSPGRPAKQRCAGTGPDCRLILPPRATRRASRTPARRAASTPLGHGKWGSPHPQRAGWPARAAALGILAVPARGILGPRRGILLFGKGGVGRLPEPTSAPPNGGTGAVCTLRRERTPRARGPATLSARLGAGASDIERGQSAASSVAVAGRGGPRCGARPPSPACAASPTPL